MILQQNMVNSFEALYTISYTILFIKNKESIFTKHMISTYNIDIAFKMLYS